MAKELMVFQSLYHVGRTRETFSRGLNNTFTNVFWFSLLCFGFLLMLIVKSRASYRLGKHISTKTYLEVYYKCSFYYHYYYYFVSQNGFSV